MNHTRPVREIDNEYLSVCASIGHKQHQIQLLSEQLVQHKKRLYELNQESDAAIEKMKQEEPPKEKPNE